MRPPSSLPPNNLAALIFPADLLLPSTILSDSECVAGGICLEPRPRPFGTPCDDGDVTTSDDVCSGDGHCAGAGMP